MDKELQGKLVEILTAMQGAVGKAGDFAMTQLPDIAQSYVLYGRIRSLFFLLAALAVIGVGCWIVQSGLKRHSTEKAELQAKGERTYSAYDPFINWMVGAMGIAAGFVLFVASAESALLMWLAPKVWLLQQLAHMLK